VQHNCNKSSTAMKEFRDIVNSKRYKRFVYFCTEPGLVRKYGVGPTVPSSLPECRNVFYKSKGNDYDIRSLIVADESEDMDLLPQFSSSDVVSVLWRVKLEEDTARPSQGKHGGMGSANTSVSPDVNRRDNNIISQTSQILKHRALNTQTQSDDCRSNTGLSHTPQKNIAPGSSISLTLTEASRNSKGHSHMSLRQRQVKRRDSISDDLSSKLLKECREESELLDLLNSEEEDFSPERVEPSQTTSSAQHSVLILCSIYWDAKDRKDLPKEFVHLLEFADSRGYPLIICGDLNAHSVLWGSPTSDRRGEIIEDLTLAFDLTVLNDGTSHTYQKGENQTHIDVSMVSSGIAERFRNWKVSKEATISDHNRIYMDMMTGIPSLQLGRNLKKVDWDEFRTITAEFASNHPIPDTWDRTQIEVQVSVLETAIKTGLDAVAPLRPRLKRFRSPYRDPEVLKQVRKCKKLCNRWRNRPHDRNLHAAYREACQHKKRLFQKADRERWQQYTSEIADPNGAAKLMRAIKRDAFVPPTLLRNNGSFTSSKEETIDLLLSTHFPGSIPKPDDGLDHYFNDIIDEGVGLQAVTPLKWIDATKVRRAIASFSDFKAHGPDEIKPVILKNLPDQEIDRLVAIYTASIRLAYVPTTWTQSRTVFIPKPGRDDYSIPKSFRPISLTSFCFKTLERLVLWHLERTTFRRKPMHEKQHAFRKGHSTELAISEVVNTIESAIHKGKYALATFLDIEGAFDNLQTDSAVKAMKNHQIDSEISKWYGFYLHNRTSSVTYGGRKTQRTLTRGTPQGGVLSPILWNLAFDSLLSKFDKGFVKICGYADDACLITSGYSYKTIIPRMQQAVDKCVAWGKQQGLNFSPTKTVVVMFNRKSNHTPPERTIAMNGKDIPYSTECRYLGLTLDERLKWMLHFSKKMQMAKGLLFKTKNALGITWGLKPHLLRWVYTGIVRPAITYGSLAWSHAVRYKSQLNQLRKVHGLVLRMLGPKRKGTPIAGLEMAAYLPPLDLYLKGESIKAYMRNKAALEIGWDGLNKQRQTVGHLHLTKKAAEAMGVPDSEWDRGPAHLHFDNNYTVEVESFDKGEDICPPRAILCYTDGSKQTKDDQIGVGCGFVVSETNKDGESKIIRESSYHLQEHNTVYQAEVTAIQKAAEHLYRLDERQHKKVTYILSDSRSALQALQKHWVSSKTLHKCIKSLNDLASKTEVRLRWIKAHVNHKGNEAADSLAKAGAVAYMQDVNLNGLVVEDLNEVPPPYSHLVNIVTKGVEKLWSERWIEAKKVDGSPLYRQSKYFFKSPDKQKAYNLLRTDRHTLGKTIQFITGHSFLKRHEGLMAQARDPTLTPDITCRLCKKGEETPFHLVMECEELFVERRRLFRQQPDNPTDPDCTVRWSARALIRFVSLDVINQMLNSEEEDIFPEEDPEEDDPVLDQ
jgi:ribonuclease HI/retron-type reverse transcriptase